MKIALTAIASALARLATETYPGGGVGEVTTTDLAKKVNKSGDTMTGALKFNFSENNIGTDSNDKFLRVNSASVFHDGANISLFGKNWSESNYKGTFNIQARDGTTSAVLKGTPSGKLTWDDKDIPGHYLAYTEWDATSTFSFHLTGTTAILFFQSAGGSTSSVYLYCNAWPTVLTKVTGDATPTLSVSFNSTTRKVTVTSIGWGGQWTVIAP